jgi:type I restriction enzyme S subunit
MNIKQLRLKILDLAIKGKLVPQDPNDEPASVLLERVRAEKEQLIKEGKIKRNKAKTPADKSHYGQLPDGWAFTRLDAICSLITDGTHQTPDYSNSGYTFLSSKNVTAGVIDWDNIMFIPQELHDTLYERLAPELGDILLAKNGTTGCAAIVDRDCIFDIYVSLALIRTFKNEISPEYLRYVIASDFVQKHFKKHLRGIGVPNLHLEYIRNAVIPICPLAEQRRIVAAIESAFTVIDEIERNKIDLQAAVAAAKSKILSLAICGKLVPQDPADEPASVLLERIRTEKETLVKASKIKRGKGDVTAAISRDNSYYEKLRFELPESWAWTTFESICVPTETKRPVGEKFSYIDIDAIDNKSHTVREIKTLLVSKAPSRAAREVAIGDTLFSMVRPYLENIAYISEGLDDCIASTGFYVCRPNHIAVAEKYLYHLLTSTYVIDGLNYFMRGDNSPSIRPNELLLFPIPLPPLNEQKRIVAQTELYYSQLNEIAGCLS